MEIDYSLNHNPDLARGLYPTLTLRTHGTLTRKAAAATHKLPSAPSFGRIDASGDDGVPG